MRKKASFIFRVEKGIPLCINFSGFGAGKQAQKNLTLGERKLLCFGVVLIMFGNERDPYRKNPEDLQGGRS